MKARIYRPAKTAMQSGQAQTRNWVLEYEPEAPREVAVLAYRDALKDPEGEVRHQAFAGLTQQEETAAIPEMSSVTTSRPLMGARK